MKRSALLLWKLSAVVPFKYFGISWWFQWWRWKYCGFVVQQQLTVSNNDEEEDDAENDGEDEKIGSCSNNPDIITSLWNAFFKQSHKNGLIYTIISSSSKFWRFLLCFQQDEIVKQYFLPPSPPPVQRRGSIQTRSLQWIQFLAQSRPTRPRCKLSFPLSP